MKNDDTAEWSDPEPNAATKGEGAEETKEKVKEKVAKGVAAVAGALKGFSEEAKKHDLAGSTKDAIQKAGETTRELAGTAKREFKETKAAVKGGPPPMDSGAPSTSSTPTAPRGGYGSTDEDLEG